MTHAEIWSGAPAIYAARIIELEKQLGECSGALQHAEKQLSMLREHSFKSWRDPGCVSLYVPDWLAIMGELP